MSTSSSDSDLSTSRASDNSNENAKMFGRNKGIQGLYNSCYLDSTLMSMFAFNSTFNYLLEGSNDSENEIKTLFRNVIKPLRAFGFTPVERVTALRRKMNDLGLDKGLMEDEKDPEEFLNVLLNKAIPSKPPLNLTSGQQAYIYQIFVDDTKHIEVPTVQHLLEESLHLYNIKFTEVPENLLLIMPRFGKRYKMYNQIFSNLYLDTREIIGKGVRTCFCCGQEKVEHECWECFKEIKDMRHRLFASCSICNILIHQHPNRKHHKPSELRPVQESHENHKYLMELYAVICIETSHYVSFLKCGEGIDKDWCFFDSMADRQGDDVNGTNISEVSSLKEENVGYWLSEQGYESLLNKDREPPRPVKRLLKDVYMCIYRPVK